MEKPREKASRTNSKGVIAWLVLGGGLALALSLGSYSPEDPAWNVQTSGGAIKNVLGAPGAWVADLCIQSFGRGAWLCVLLAWVCGMSLWFQRSLPIRWLAFAGFAGIAWTTSSLLHLRWGGPFGDPASAGGALGAWLADGLQGQFGRTGAYLGLVALTGIAATWTTRFVWWRLGFKVVLVGGSWATLGVRALSSWRLAARERRKARLLLAVEPPPKEADPSALPAHELPALALEPLWLEEEIEEIRQDAVASGFQAIPDLTPPDGTKAFDASTPLDIQREKASPSTDSHLRKETDLAKLQTSLQIGPALALVSPAKAAGLPSLKIDAVALSISAETACSMPPDDVRDEDILSVRSLSQTSLPPLPASPRLSSPSRSSASVPAEAAWKPLLPPLPALGSKPPAPSSLEALPLATAKVDLEASSTVPASDAPLFPLPAGVSKTAEFGVFCEDGGSSDASAENPPALDSSPPSEGSSDGSRTAAWSIPQGQTALLLAIAQEQEEPEPQVLSALFKRTATQSRQAFLPSSVEK